MNEHYFVDPGSIMRVAVTMPQSSCRTAITLVALLSVVACRRQAVDPAPLPTPSATPATAANSAPPESSKVLATYDEIIRQVDATEEAFCITLARKAADWKPVRSAWAPNGRQCPVTRG